MSDTTDISVTTFLRQIERAADGLTLPDDILSMWYNVREPRYSHGIIQEHRELFHGIVPLDTTDVVLPTTFEETTDDDVPTFEETTDDDVVPEPTSGKTTHKGKRPPSPRATTSKRRRKKKKNATPVQYTLKFKKN